MKAGAFPSHGRKRAVLAAAAVAFASVSSLARASRAFCRTFNEPPIAATAGACPTEPAGANALYWRSSCVGYSIQRSASSQATLPQVEDVVAQAFAAWSSADCAQTGQPTVNAVDQGPVDCALVEYNSDRPNQNVIVFRDDVWPHDDPNNTLGLTTVTFNLETGEIYDADMEINSNQVKLVLDGPVPDGTFDLKSIVTHEAGHFLGLAHTPDADAVMFARYHATSLTLTPDDVGGICSIYPPDGTRGTGAGPIAAGGCDPTPRHGFSTACGSSQPSNPPAAPPAHGGCSVAARANRAGNAQLWIAGLGFSLLRLRRRPRLATTGSM